MFEKIQEYLLSLAGTIPLEYFALVASFLEEIVAPIPSPVVSGLVGSLATTNGYNEIVAVLFLGLLMAIGKTIACAVIYVVMYYAGSVTAHRLEKFFGISAKNITTVAHYLKGSVHDYVLLILMRAIPFVPSFPISVVAGIIKTPFQFYITASFIGSYIRSCFFIYIGFKGISLYREFVQSTSGMVLPVSVLSAIALCIYGYWLFTNPKKRK